MRALIRFLTRGAGGTVEQRDKVFEGDAITLGRATDQVLHLKDRRVELEHARIFRRGERLLITSGALAGVTVNGAVRRDAPLAAGDVVVIGSNTLKLFAPPGGFDVAFTFELDATARAAEAAREAPMLDLADTRLAKRPWAWGLFLLVGVVVLIVPSLGINDSGMAGFLRATALPDDGWWSSGALSTAHQSIGTACESCHALPFVRVRNAECLQCHTQLAGHGERSAALFGSKRCTACHLEHNEPATLVRRDARTCVDCHREPQRFLEPGASAQPVTDFATEHPQFRVTLLQPARLETDGRHHNHAVPRRLSLAEAAGQDHSGLEFAHDVHLDRRGINGPGGRVMLDCGNCHRAEEGGARMRPIEMERDCASCHRLDFEPADPTRQVPHGDADAVMRTLIEYYSARYLEEYPDPHATASPARRVARPGVELTAAQRVRALERARSKAQATARDLFERRTCSECHAVTASTDTNGDPSWSVAPVVLTGVWMPKANFSHARHSTTLTACTTCHSATESRQSSDVLMPGIDTCRECHGGTAALTPANRVPSDCAMCHSFHQPGSGTWTPRAPRASDDGT